MIYTQIEVDEIVTCLMAGGIVLIPTDTVYGLAVCPRFSESVDRLYALKSRPRNRNLPIMVADIKDLELLGVEINKRAMQLLTSRYVPGAITLAMGFLKKGPLLPWLSGRDEVAVRIPNDARLLSVLKKTGPLLVTSANRHGHPITPDNIEEILSQLDGEPDIVIDGGKIKTTPSTLINCHCDPPIVEREGVISQSELSKYLR